MGKIRIRTIGTSEEEVQKEKVKKRRQTKKEKTKKSVKGIGLKGGERVVDMGTPIEELPKTPKAPKSPKSPKALPTKRSQDYLHAKKLLDAAKTYSLNDALPLLKKINLCRFDPSVELHLTTTETGKLARVSLPHPIKSKPLKILVLSREKQLWRRVARAEEPQRKDSNNSSVTIGDEKTIDQISQTKKAHYDLIFATPDIMPKIAKIAKILGPKKLMPNPKNQTVTADPLTAIKNLTASPKLEIKTEAKFPLVHLVLGKLSTPLNHLRANIEAIFSAINPQRIKKAVLKTTMSPAIKISLPA